MITAVNQVIAPRQVGVALGTISTIWNIVGSIFLATSTAVFHSIEARTSFLPAFHGVIDFNISLCPDCSYLHYLGICETKKKWWKACVVKCLYHREDFSFPSEVRLGYLLFKTLLAAVLTLRD